MSFPIFPTMPESSKLLVFTADNALDAIASSSFLIRLNTFLSTWSSHGSQLEANSLLISNRVLFIAVDETQSMASGCSVDAFTNFMKSECASTGVDWFNRHQVLHRSPSDNDVFSDWMVNTLDDFIKLVKSGSLAENTQTLNTSLTTLKEGRASLIQTFQESWYCRLI